MWLWNDRQSKFPFNNKGNTQTLATIAEVVGIVGAPFTGGASLGLTALGLASGGLGGVKTPGLPEAPEAPDPTKAAQTAKDAQTKERKMLLATGGQTQYAGSTGAGMLLGSDIHTINLGGM